MSVKAPPSPLLTPDAPLLGANTVRTGTVTMVGLLPIQAGRPDEMGFVLDMEDGSQLTVPADVEVCRLVLNRRARVSIQVDFKAAGAPPPANGKPTEADIRKVLGEATSLQRGRIYAQLVWELAHAQKSPALQRLFGNDYPRMGIGVEDAAQDFYDGNVAPHELAFDAMVQRCLGVLQRLWACYEMHALIVKEMSPERLLARDGKG